MRPPLGLRACLPPAASLFAVLALSACSQAPTPVAEGVEASDSYVRPPEVMGVEAGQTGLILSGQASPDARVRVLTLGRAFGVTADAEGRFVVEVPAGREGVGQTLTVAVLRDGQPVTADGWLYVPTGAPHRSVLLRPGAAAWPVGPARGLRAVDYDGRALAVAGRAEPGTRVRVLLDGREAAAFDADSEGLYHGLIVTGRAPGPALLRVLENDVVSQDVRLDLSGPVALAAPTGQAVGGAWRVDWALPAGGAQATYLIWG